MDPYLKNKASPTYSTWHAMWRRCTNKKHARYKDYGGSGVTVCAAWKDFSQFVREMGMRPPGHTLDRIKNYGPYIKSNCRWATPKGQARNRGDHNAKIRFRGKTQCLAAWAEELGVNYMSVDYRLRRGWSVRRAFTEPYKKRKKH